MAQAKGAVRVAAPIVHRDLAAAGNAVSLAVSAVVVDTAGGALGGMLGASLRLIPGFSEGWIRTPFFEYDPVSQTVSLGLFVAACVYLWWDATRKGAGI